MRLPRINVRRWMIVTAVVATDCAGVFYGSDDLMVFCVVATAAATVLVPIAIIAHRLGPTVFWR
jgi:hypothetical protein